MAVGNSFSQLRKVWLRGATSWRVSTGGWPYLLALIGTFLILLGTTARHPKPPPQPTVASTIADWRTHAPQCALAHPNTL